MWIDVLRLLRSWKDVRWNDEMVWGKVYMLARIEMGAESAGNYRRSYMIQGLSRLNLPAHQSQKEKKKVHCTLPDRIV